MFGVPMRMCSLSSVNRRRKKAIVSFSFASIALPNDEIAACVCVREEKTPSLTRNSIRSDIFSSLVQTMTKTRE